MSNYTSESPDEILRLEALRRFRILDTPGDEGFLDFARLAAALCQAPVASISFIDESRQWNKSQVGPVLPELPRVESISALALSHEGVLVIPDLTADPRTCGLPEVTGPPGARFFAGVPLCAPGSIGGKGRPIGVLAVLDVKPRELAPGNEETLQLLARQVAAHLDLRRQAIEAESARRDSEAFYHSLVEAIPQNIFRKDRSGKFTFANSRFCQALQRSQAQVIGKTDFDLFPPELALKYQQDDQRVLAERTTIRATEQHQDQNGRTLWVQVIKAPLYDLEGNIIGLQGIFWDETERYNAEEALAHERDLLRAMLDHLPDSIYFKDRESRFVAISRALATRLGLKSPEEAYGKTDRFFFDSAHAREALDDEQTIMRTGQPLVGKTERELWPDGERWVLTTKVPLRNRQGEITGTFGVSKDITDLKASEKELADARDVALESARLKSEFLANMSHEIRTPLNAVIGMTGLLLDTPLESEQCEFAETIRHSAEALLGIINDILDFSKIEAGKLAIENIEFDLTEVLEGTAELLAETAQAKGIELATWIAEDVPRQLYGDPGRLRQVLTNLAANGVKFTEKGEVVMLVEKERENQKSVVLKFTVRDTGIGIPPESQARLFQPFVQADGSTTRRFGGTGLGLAISRQLVELMHGEIGLASTPGQGSIFWFSLPFEKQARQRPALAMASTLEGIRLLVVDDNSTNREIVHRQVLAWRMRNGLAESGAQALDLLEGAAAAGDPYQLVLLDMQMPGMDGLALAREISSRQHLGAPRLIMLTSMGHLQAEKRWRECGISAYLIKPVREHRLYDTLVSVLRGTGGAHSAWRTAENKARPSRAPMRILVAEDNVVNQKVALRQLQKLGFSADAVANGLEVLQALRTVPYDVILMDGQMPELDGYEAARQIRSEERGAGSPPRTRIIAMTANALSGDREACLDAGMDDYISKPVKIDELEAALGRAAEALARMKEAENDIPVLDESALDSLRELQMPGEPSPVSEICEIFLTDAPTRLDNLRIAFEQGNIQAVEAAAHTLKGSSSNLGGKRLAHAALQVLQFCRRGEMPPADAVAAVPREFDLLRPLLEHHRDHPGV